MLSIRAPQDNGVERSIPQMILSASHGTSYLKPFVVTAKVCFPNCLGLEAHLSLFSWHCWRGYLSFSQHWQAGVAFNWVIISHVTQGFPTSCTASPDLTEAHSFQTSQTPGCASL